MRKLLAGACAGFVASYMVCLPINPVQLVIVAVAGAVIYFVRGTL